MNKRQDNHMKTKKSTMYIHGYVWVMGVTLLLGILFCLYQIPLVKKYVSPVFKASDLISFIGMIVLGFISYTQTQKANELSIRLMKMQKREYEPLLICMLFKGSGRHQIDNWNPKTKSGTVCILKARMKNGNNEADYIIPLFDDNIDSSLPIYARNYEIHVRYIGKYPAKDIRLLNVKFEDQSWNRNYSIDMENAPVSMINNDNAIYIINMVSNHDFLSLNPDATHIVSANLIELTFEMEDFDGYKKIEVIKISKCLMNQSGEELSLSYNYDYLERE